MMENKRFEIKISGIVQGVGFRPFVFTTAKSLSLKGWIINTNNGVTIEVEGEEKSIQDFLAKIQQAPPPLALIKSIETKEKPFKGYGDFEIGRSSKGEEKRVFVSPDVSICEDCRRELFDPKDRRFLYPFINCTNCGPRFTIVKDTPYDRVNTTMAKFPMCQACESEYGNPEDRRYHAQPVSCYDCGPKLMLLDKTLKDVGNENAIADAIKLILSGHILAVKGLGGYHLVCNAKNKEAVKELRKRKERDEKPFAIMVKDYLTAGKYCIINDEEKKLLESIKRPIVLLKKGNEMLPYDIAPGNPYLGVMLPYTPVHVLLLEKIQCSGCDGDRQLEAIVMTSGNRSSEPIYYRDEEAFENLKDIADYFLTNDRDIFIRTDDSVTRSFDGKEYIIRRSRGYVPEPVTCEGLEAFKGDKIPSVLACGGELKNTFCLNNDKEFFLSHHIGDLENFETLISFEEGINHFSKLFNVNYEVIAHDLHPEYLSTKYATSQENKIKISVQHHHAHIASCMAENGLNEDVIGVAFDGTGYGEDGNIWGGEFFTGSFGGFHRAGHLEYVKMPGGEMAIKQPWRMAVSYLYKYYGDEIKINEDSGIEIKGIRLLEGISSGKISGVIQMMDKGLNSPLTSSMGRVFDAVSALIGIRSIISYEGQAAIEMEYALDEGNYEGYDFDIDDRNGSFIIGLEDILGGIIKDIRSGTEASIISAKFHETMSNVVLKGCKKIREKSRLNKVVMSGGVFQNITLLKKCVKKLEMEGFHTYIHSKVPSNDGGISLGQAVIAISKLK